MPRILDNISQALLPALRETLAAFEKSELADDWRERMRLYLVRRTHRVIQDNYAETDPTDGRRFLTFADGTRSYFPKRQPRTVKSQIDDLAGRVIELRKEGRLCIIHEEEESLEPRIIYSIGLAEQDTEGEA